MIATTTNLNERRDQSSSRAEFHTLRQRCSFFGMLAAMSLLLFLHNAIGIQELARKTMGVQATKIVG